MVLLSPRWFCAERRKGPSTMTVSVTRLCRLYNIKAREEQPARDRKPAVPAGPAQKGVSGAGKTWVREKLILRDPNKPNIPGTPVRRLPTFPLTEKVEVALDTEIARVFSELQKWRQEQLQERRQAQPLIAKRADPTAE